MNRKDLKREKIRAKRRIVELQKKLSIVGRGGDCYHTIINGEAPDRLSEAMRKAINRTNSINDKMRHTREED